MKPVQYFSDDYLERCHAFSVDATIEYLESFRQLQSPADKTKLISIKIPQSLLAGFKRKAELHNVKYQTQIKKLMREWLES